jgi:hypothetical protein
MGIASRLAQAVSSWYHGRYIPPDNDPDSNFVFVLGHYDRPLLARIISALAEFYIRHWQWVWTTILAVLALAFSSPWIK